jgi:hypothetical protein
VTDELAPRRERRKPGVKPGRKAGSAAGPITGDKAIILTEKDAKALSLRRAGATLAQVADECGYTHASAAGKAITRALKQILPDQTRDEYRREEIDRLDRLQAAHWTRALSASEDADKSARVVLACINARAKLRGLEAPAQLDVSVRRGELVHVEILDLLDKDTLEALKPFQDRMVELSELRAGAIEATATDA